MSNAVTTAQAQAVLTAVKAQFHTYLEPMDLGNGLVLAPACPEPTLNMDYDGTPAIVWEEGPSEWAYRVNEGGTSEEEAALAAAASEEFGHKITSSNLAPAALPKGVEVEAFYSFVLAIYPA